MHKRLLPLLAVSLLALASCGGDKDEAKPKPPESAERLYNEALNLFDAHNYKEAVKAFEEVERQHPSSDWATNAQIMSAYSSYEAEDYDGAIGTLQGFVKLYPSNSSTPYAYYLIALCYYEQISDVGRDQKITEQSMQALREVIRRFPDTEYARDARVKLDLTVDHLAGKEMEIGRYYLRHDDYLSAINRFRFVVENYQTTSHVPEALHRLVECYLKLGVKEEAQRYAAVLGHNFPSSQWYRDSYKLMTGEDKPKEAGDSASWWPHLNLLDSDKKENAPDPEKLKTPPAEVKPVKLGKEVDAAPATTAAPVQDKEDNSSWWPHLNVFGSDKKEEMPDPEKLKASPAAGQPATPAAAPVEEKEDKSWWDHVVPW